jgi:excisionase family DNA binding protein
MRDEEPRSRTRRRFETVASVARLFDVSEVTIYRAIHDGEFPAIKVRGRYVIPSSAVDAMEAAALASGAVVDAAAWAHPAGAQAGVASAVAQPVAPSGGPR